MHTKTDTSCAGALKGFSSILTPSPAGEAASKMSGSCKTWIEDHQIREELETCLGWQEQVVICIPVRVPAEGSEGRVQGELKVVLCLMVPTCMVRMGHWMLKRVLLLTFRYNLILVCWRKPAYSLLKSFSSSKKGTGSREWCGSVGRVLGCYTQNPRFNSKYHIIWAWWHIFVIPALRR